MSDRPIQLERMTWPEVGSALAEGHTTVIVPCGAVEQHGPHLPLFMDAEHGTHLAVEVARRLGQTLVAPTIRVGCSEHHLAFPGTVSLSVDTFVAVCRDYVRSLSRHGFKRVCLLPTHGGNFTPLENALQELNSVAGTSCTVVAYTDLLGLLSLWRQAVEAAGGPGQNVGGHADVAESSLMLLWHPELVRQDLATSGFAPEWTREGFERLIQGGFRTVTPNGILGDARGMSREAGERCLAALADRVVERFSG